MGKIAILDIVMLIALVAGSLNGLRVGALRQLASLVTLYLSVILTTRFYTLLLRPVKRLLVGAPSSMVEGVLFFVLLIIMFAILSVLFLAMQPQCPTPLESPRTPAIHAESPLAPEAGRIGQTESRPAPGVSPIRTWR